MLPKDLQQSACDARDGTTCFAAGIKKIALQESKEIFYESNDKNIVYCLLLCLCCGSIAQAQNKQANNPVIFADVPDMSMIRVKQQLLHEQYLCTRPGVPIMKSDDLVNWKNCKLCV